MKRYFLILIAVFTFSILSGCGRTSENFEQPANFYYKSTDVSFFEEDSVISPEIRETARFNGNMLDTVNAYLQGPVSDKLTSPFPTGLKAVKLTTDESNAQLHLNEESLSLSGLDATIAYSCLCATVTELTGCETVDIHLENSDGVTVQTLHFSYTDLLFIDPLP